MIEVQRHRVISSARGAGTTGDSHTKHEVRPLPHSIYKYQLRVNHLPSPGGCPWGRHCSRTMLGGGGLLVGGLGCQAEELGCSVILV